MHLAPTGSFIAFVLAGLAAGLPAAEPEPQSTSLRPWTEYRTIMWIGESAHRRPDKLPQFFEQLRRMGINTGMVHGDGSLQALTNHGFAFYVENMINRGLCLKWNSKVRDWEAFVTTWAKTGRPESALARDYCLDDPEWRSWARGEMERLARKYAPHQPLAYDLRDELSVTISANPFDYDFNPVALAAFRAWLQTQYRDLAALNAQWETRFGTWAEVLPFTTDRIKNRMASGEALPRGQPDWQAVQRLEFDPAQARQQPTRWNFSPWCDFRTYMDVSLARTLEELRQTAHAVDPRTPVGIEGTQMPHAFGGYDLRRLAGVLDWVEPYDIGNAREIFGSFMPGKPLLTTVFEDQTGGARRRLWHLLLEGDRGCIIWWSEDCIDWRSADYALTPKARALAPVLREMTSPLAQLFLRAQREHDPVYLHYSQPSIQVNWLLESTRDGSTWPRRFSSFEADHNRMAKVRNSWLKAFQDLGFTPRFVDSSELTRLRSGVLVLPEALALADAETEVIRRFLESTPPQKESGNQPGLRAVLCDGTPGLFDEHGRLRARGPLDDLFPPARSHERTFAATRVDRPATARTGDMAAYAQERLLGQGQSAWLEWVAQQVRALPREVSLPVTARTRIHRFKLGRARLLAFERNIDYHMSEELKQRGGNEALERAIDLEATLAQPAHVYDLRTQRYLGHTAQFRFTLDPWQPSLLGLLAERVYEGDLVRELLGSAKQ